MFRIPPLHVHFISARGIASDCAARPGIAPRVCTLVLFIVAGLISLNSRDHLMNIYERRRKAVRNGLDAKPFAEGQSSTFRAKVETMCHSIVVLTFFTGKWRMA